MPLNPSSPLARLLNGPVHPGRILWIGLRPRRKDAMSVVETAVIDAHAGLVGDHYASRAGARQVTLIQAESLRSIASHLGRSDVAALELRRNIVTEGINLVALKGRHFRIGEAVLQTTGECHPCSRMEDVLGMGGYNAVRGFGGITARVVTGGAIRIGDAIEALPVAG
ncbi:MOSC domain-containing protein [Paraburkholderia phymatum]|uniref:MOSC domain containing protein n=1 Tax=Paraburkholderia phymatum (strain DSM 17167 / CIP 108236 / LMG 21445 / STM815) TaxID=391038 RepID=B2JUM9_PARP8|nr:MOSC domain-containing protein [Paraburkholderia phymatum]ACC76200.1 MOSC domain containing protein [Paraburkholderia phymatum STM815]